MENILSGHMLEDLADVLATPFKPPGMSGYHNAREKVISKATDNSKFRNRYRYNKNGGYKHRGYEARAKIHVFCPPLLQYFLLALALAFPDHDLKTCEFQVVIHPDDRLLAGGAYSVEEGRQSLSQLYGFLQSVEPGRPIDTLEPGMELESRRQFLATRFDQVWIDQRVTVTAIESCYDSCKDDPIDASDFFRESKEGVEVALIVVMAGPQFCEYITKTAPLVGPDNPVLPMQIYRLQELADVDDRSAFRWKTRHFCRIHPP